MRDLHSSLKTEIIGQHQASGVNYALARLQHGKTDVSHSLHAYPASYTLSDFSTPGYLRYLGFQESNCSFFPSGKCFVREVGANFDMKGFADTFGRSFNALSDANKHFTECGIYIVKGAGPSFSGKAISSDGHNSPKKQRMKNSDDNVFHYVLTWVEGGRDKGWVIHYRPQHPPLSADLEAALEFLHGFQQFSECPEYDFEQCFWRFIGFEAGSGQFGLGNADFAHRCFDAHAAHFAPGLEKLLGAHVEIAAYGMNVLTLSPRVAEPESSQQSSTARMKNRSVSKYKYDVALSFAGTERMLAEQLATMLKEKEIAVFYDGFYPEHLWGKDLAVEFDNIYRKESRYCVLFVSPEYANRMWTIHERRSALARLLEDRGKEYILPIKVTDAELDGLSPTIGYLDLAVYPIPTIAEILLKKLAS